MAVRLRDPLDDAELVGSLADLGDYDEDSPPSEYDLHCIQAPPFLERRTDGSTAHYLPLSPRTLQPAPFARCHSEWQNLPDGIRGRSAGGPPGLWSYDTEASTNVRLARLRAGLAYVRRDAAHMARWMDRHGAAVGPRAAKVYELFFLQGYRRRTIANKMGLLPSGVDGHLKRLRAEAGSPVRHHRALRAGALLAPRSRPLAPPGAPLRPRGTRGSTGAYG